MRHHGRTTNSQSSYNPHSIESTDKISTSTQKESCPDTTAVVLATLLVTSKIALTKDLTPLTSAMTLWEVLAVTSSETRPEAGIRDTRPRNIALRSFPQARHVAAGQRTATLRRTSTQVEAARALQLGLRSAGGKEPGPWIHHLGRLLRHPSETVEVEVHIVLNRQDAYRKADLPTVKHGPALPRPSTILDSTLPVHQDRARGLVALQAARLRRLIISRRIARLVRQERVLAPLATPTELATILLVTMTLL
jgi:hypothetical protein